MRNGARRTARTGLGVATALALGLLATACGSSTPTSTAGEGSAAPSGSATTALATADGSTPGSTASCAASTMTAHRGLAYAAVPGVDANLLSLDVYQPTRPAGCGPAPIVVWVHGGGWRQGDKKNQMADKVRLAQEQGWVLASVNYRLSPAGPSSAGAPDAVRYPTHDQDVAGAVAFVRQHATDYGGDPDRIALMGHSAGAGIVSLVGTDPRFLTEAGVPAGTVDCVASLDTEAYDVTRQATAGGQVGELYRNAFGTDPATWTQASPLTYTTPGASLPDFLVVTRGSRDRQDLSATFVDAVRSTGARATLVQATGLDHEGVNDAVGQPGDTVVTPPLVEFLDRCFA